MSTYLYRGYDKDGTLVNGCKNNSDEKSVLDSIENLSLKNIQVFKSETSYSEKEYTFVSPKEISIFCKQMSAMIFSNITLLEGTILVSEQTSNKELKKALLEVNNFMNNGLTFSESIGMFTNVFNKYLLNMIHIGEMSGTLDTVFTKMSDYYDKESKIQKKIKSAITYPLILVIMMSALIALLVVKILPMFNDILNSMGGEMPALTKWILNLSSFFRNYGVIILIIIFILAIGLYIFSKTEKGKYYFDKKIATSNFGKYIYSKTIASRFSRSLSILMKSGVNILTGIVEASGLLDNKYLQEKILLTVDSIKNGKDLSDALKEMNIFPPLFIKMITIGEKTGKTDEMLEKTASVFDEEVDDAIEKFTLFIEPAMVIILSIVVGIILISVMLPMISIITNIG